MPTLFLGLVVLVLLFFAAKWFSKADPKQAARVLRYIGGGAALLVAVFLLMRGQIGAALSIGLLGLGVLGYVSLWPQALVGAHKRAPVECHACAPLFFWKWNSRAAPTI